MNLEVLIKFGERQHMEELLKEGHLYLNTVEHYRKCERDSERHDPSEGVAIIRHLAGGKLLMKDPESGLNVEVAQLTHSTVREFHSTTSRLNVYCLHYSKTKDKVVRLNDLVDERARKGFGDTAVIIVDAASFVTRVKNAAKESGFLHSRKLVEYVDLSSKNGEVGPFMKDVSFAHQKELRVVVHTGNANPSPISLRIGSIEDIAILVPADAIGEISISGAN